MLIIGITGTLGAGKGTIVEYLVDKKEFLHFSVRGYLIAIIKERKLPINRDSMVLVANELREKYSPSFIAEELYKQALSKGKNCVIESIRTLGEVEALRRKDSFYLFAVNADPKVRYNRIVVRASETDNISYETFLENEKREMTSTDPNKQNISSCISQADFLFNNNGSIEDLITQVEDVIKDLK